jgi:hypothetical protein
VVNLRDGTVESDDIETVISSVQDQVLAHDSQANEAEISSGFMISICRAFRGFRGSARCPANVDAGKTSAAMNEKDS